MDKNKVLICLPGSDSFVYYCPADLYCALVRAKVRFQEDRNDQCMHIASWNSNAPLTDKEKDMLLHVLCDGDFPYTVMFDN